MSPRKRVGFLPGFANYVVIAVVHVYLSSGHLARVFGGDLNNWIPLPTYTLSTGWFYFSDAKPYKVINFFYRVYRP